MFQYNSLILEHFYQAKFAGELDPAEANVLTAQVGDLDSSCIMQLFIKIDGSNVVIAAKFKVFGCVAAIATLDWLCARVLGKNLTELQILNAKQIAQALQLPSQKYYCALMAEDLLQKISGID